MLCSCCDNCEHVCVICFFFFKQKTAYEMRISDWSSDVCSSDLSFPSSRRFGRQGRLDGRAGLQLEHAGHDNLVSRCHALDDPYQIDEGRTQCDGLHRGLVLGIDLPDIRTFRPTGDGPRRHEHPLGRTEETTSELQSLMRI